MALQEEEHPQRRMRPVRTERRRETIRPRSSAGGRFAALLFFALVVIVRARVFALRRRAAVRVDDRRDCGRGGARGGGAPQELGRVLVVVGVIVIHSFGGCRRGTLRGGSDRCALPRRLA